MVTTTVRMLDGVHGHTSDLRPVLSLVLELELGGTRLQQRLVGPAASGDDADHGAAASRNRLALARGEADSGLGAVLVVADDRGRGPAGAGEGASVGVSVLDVAHRGPLGDQVHGQDVAGVDVGWNVRP